MSDTLDSILDDITRDDEPIKRLNVELPKSRHQDFKAVCTRKDQSMGEVVQRFVEAYEMRHL